VADVIPDGGGGCFVPRGFGGLCVGAEFLELFLFGPVFGVFLPGWLVVGVVAGETTGGERGGWMSCCAMRWGEGMGGD
jgi:hypothetical protein